MKNLTKLMIKAIAVAGLAAVANAQSLYFALPGPVPTQIALPAGITYPLGGLAAIGTQNYACNWDNATLTYQWKFVGPEAKLYDANGAVAGTHAWTGSGQPYWTYTGDGSWIVAQAINQVGSPYGSQQAISWVLLGSQSASGIGKLGRASNVQRLYTNGGVPPIEACDGSKAGQVRKVAYTAMYYFWGSGALYF
jgi:hypothetical protein